MSQSRQGTPSVTATCLVTLPEDRQGLVSYSFLLSSSSFFFFFFLLKLGGFRLTYFFLAISFFFLLTICIFFHMLDRISTKLGQNDQLVSGYKSYALFDLKGHVGVTGVKNVIFYRNCYSSFMFYWIFTTLDQNDQ